MHAYLSDLQFEHGIVVLIGLCLLTLLEYRRVYLFTRY